MLKQLIEQYPILFKVIFSLVLFALVTLNLSKKARKYKQNFKLIINIYLTFILGLFIYWTYNVLPFSNIYKQILAVFGINQTFTQVLIILILIGLIITVVNLKFNILKLKNQIKNIDHKYSLDKNSQEYKKRKEKIYRSQ